MPERKNAYPSVVLTGAAGWLGQRVVSALLGGGTDAAFPASDPKTIRCLLAPHEPAESLLERGVAVIRGDLRDADARHALTRDVEGALLIHMAGVIHPPGRSRIFDEVNHRASLALFEAAACAGLARIVAVSSNSPMGANGTPDGRFTEDSPYNPYMGYGLSKQRMEVGLRAMMERPGNPEIVIVRAPWFYGPGQPPRQTQFFTMIKKGKFPLMGAGSNRRSMAYVDSLAQGLLLAGRVPEAAGRIYWIADERPYAMTEVVETVRAVLREDFGMKVADRTLRVPALVADLARIADRTLQSCGLYHQKIHVLSEMNLTIACDIGRARAELGYAPLVALREGMRRSVAWCLAEGHRI